MFLSTFLPQIFFQLSFRLRDFLKIAGLVLAGVSINWLNPMIMPLAVKNLLTLPLPMNPWNFLGFPMKAQQNLIKLMVKKKI